MDPDTIFDNNDTRSKQPRFKQESMKANQCLIDLIQDLAYKKQATPAQISLAWVLAKKLGLCLFLVQLNDAA